MDSLKTYTDANRDAWDQVATLHQQAKKIEWDKLFAVPGYSCLPKVQNEILHSLPLAGRNVIQLACNNGVELLSIKNNGANRCVGVDISNPFIAEANERANAVGIECEYYCQNVYQLDSSLLGQFDLVYLSVGCLGWMPDLVRFFEIVGSLLRADGYLFIHEMHPFCDLLATDQSAHADRYRITEPYFRQTPTVISEGLDYMGGQTYAAKTQYWFTHTISDIFNALRAQNMTVLRFDEYPEDISLTLQDVARGPYALPLSYRLLAKKAI